MVVMVVLVVLVMVMVMVMVMVVVMVMVMVEVVVMVVGMGMLMFPALFKTAVDDDCDSCDGRVIDALLHAYHASCAPRSLLKVCGTSRDGNCSAAHL